MGLESVEIVMDCEDHFEIVIGDKEAEAVVTAGDLLELICDKLRANGMRANPEVIFREVQDIISKNLVVSKSDITLKSRFIEDLGMP